MFRLFRTVFVVALAFAAGVQFERADARTTCGEQDGWSPYLTCVTREVLAELVS